MRKTVALLALAAQGCTTYSGNHVRPLRPLEIPLAPYQWTATAALTGSLAYEGGCLMLRGDEPAAWLLPVWPDGTVFNGTALMFHVPGKAAQPIVIGQEIHIDGQPAGAHAASAYLDRFRSRCGGEPFVVSRVAPAN